MQEGNTYARWERSVIDIHNDVAYWTAIGDVRGECGHKHRSYEAAAQCVERDRRAIRRAYPYTSPYGRSYSDRLVYAVLRDGRTVAVDAEGY